MLLLSLIAFFPVLFSGFIWDDVDVIFVSASAADFSTLWKIWTRPDLTAQYYPLTYSSLWLEFKLFGYQPFWFHLSNILIHAGASTLLWRCLRRMKVPGAWLAAALFAVHPIQVETIAWAHERKNVLAFFFVMLSFRLWLDCERPRWKGWSLFFFGCAMLSKSVACAMPAVMLLVEWWRGGLPDLRKNWRITLPYFALALPLALLTPILERVVAGAGGVHYEIEWWQRFLIAGRALWFYVGKLAWPHPLVFVYPRWELGEGLPWTWLYPLGWLLLLFAALVFASKGKRGSFTALASFSGILFPALGFFDVFPFVYSFVADHFQYMAAAALIPAFVWMIFLLPKRAAWACGGLLIVVLAALSHVRSKDYETLERLWTVTIRDNPGAWLAWNNLGVIQARSGRAAEAHASFLEAVRLNKNDVGALLNLGKSFILRGEGQLAVPHLERAVRIRPDLYDAHSLLERAQSTRNP